MYLCGVYVDRVHIYIYSRIEYMWIKYYNRVYVDRVLEYNRVYVDRVLYSRVY